MSTGPVRTAPLQPYADAAQAWTALARAWGLPAAGRCNDATAQALACHEGRADWALLQRLDRPLLLALHDGGLVLLRAVNADAALLAGAAGDQRVDRSTLQAAWTGAIATWWRPPPGWGDGRRRPGPEAAAWALQRLTALQGPLQGQAAGQPARDEWLRQRVFAFQVAQALPLDGLAGPVTLMMLNRASQVDEPRLQRLEP